MDTNDALLKVTMNFFHRDIEKIRDRFGDGWSREIREQVRSWVKEMEKHDGK